MIGIVSSIIILFLSLLPGLFFKGLSSGIHNIYLAVIYCGIPLIALIFSWRNFRYLGIAFIVCWFGIILGIFILGGLAIGSSGDFR